MNDTYIDRENEARDNKNYTHIHKYFMFQVKTDFEPLYIDNQLYYKKVDYGFSSCSCGSVKKSPAEYHKINDMIV